MSPKSIHGQSKRYSIYSIHNITNMGGGGDCFLCIKGDGYSVVYTKLSGRSYLRFSTKQRKSRTNSWFPHKEEEKSHELHCFCGFLELQDLKAAKKLWALRETRRFLEKPARLPTCESPLKLRLCKLRKGCLSDNFNFSCFYNLKNIMKKMGWDWVENNYSNRTRAGRLANWGWSSLYSKQATNNHGVGQDATVLVADFPIVNEI